MVWRLKITATAEKQLSKLDKSVARKVIAYLDELRGLDDPAAKGHPMTGPLAGLHRYRIGQLRILVEIERGQITIVVLNVDRRDSIY